MKKIVLVTFLFTFSLSICSAAIRFVTVTGAGLMNGSSWANAFPAASLQAAITASAAGDEVWVACGTYFTTNTLNRNISFSMQEGVAIYGSFAGTETTLLQRVFTCGPCSILSGEIGVAGIADNSYHVINNGNLSNAAILDGFVITGANDSRAATLTEGLGGGIFNRGSGAGNNSSPTIRNCVIRNNRATFGGGIFNDGFNGGNANPLISHCIITNNTATDGGGGIDNFGLAGNASPTITNCLIYNNTALTAGGMYCWGGNVGGNANPVILNCVFANNSATAGNAGGLIADNANSSGPFSNGTSNPVVRNSIFWGNTASGAGPQFAIKGTGTFTATYSGIDMAGQSSPHIISGAGTGNIFTNPQFLNMADADGADNCWMTGDDGLNLQITSPVKNMGNNTGVPANDLKFAARIQETTVDIGAYETSAGVLPLRWIYFSGSNKSNTIQLQWATADEVNTDHFIIEKSGQGLFFSSLAIVAARGNTSSQTNYTFTDEGPFEGDNFYKIKQVDKDNRFEYSSVIRLRYEPVSVIKKAFAPGRSNLFIELTAFNPNINTANEWHLYSITGGKVARGKIFGLVNYDVLPPLAAGIYVLHVKVNNKDERMKILLH